MEVWWQAAWRARSGKGEQELDRRQDDRMADMSWIAGRMTGDGHELDGGWELDGAHKLDIGQESLISSWEFVNWRAGRNYRM